MMAARSSIDRHRTAGEDPADVVAALQVAGQLRVVVAAEAAEVHDPLDRGAGRRVAEGGGRLAVARREVGPAAHRVDEVVGRVDTVHGALERRRVGHVAPHDLDPASPLLVADLGGVAGEAADRVAGGEELGNEPAADVAGRARHEDGGHPGSLPRVG